MKLIKNQKLLRIFSNGSLNFYYENFFLSKNQSFLFHEKDFTNFHFYKKNRIKIVNLNDTKNLNYRKSYFKE